MARCVRYIKYTHYRDCDYDITSKVNVIYNSAVDRSRKGEPTLKSARLSAAQSHKNLFSLLRSNVWAYFVTLTFGDEDRLNDDYCRSEFAKWRKMVKRKFPSMFYLAVPEYHKKGGIHYHLVVGGITESELGLIDSGRVLHNGKAWKVEDFDRNGFVYDESKCEGCIIFNIPSWNSWSTATEVRDTDAVSKYVGKYITKVNLDPRFYGKKRFYTSHNLNRPEIACVVSTDFRTDEDDPVALDGGLVTYNDSSVGYRTYAVDLSKEDIIRARLRGELPIQPHLSK